MFNLRYTTAYKNLLSDTNRIGHHNYVITQRVGNTSREYGKVFDDLSDDEREHFDKTMFKHLVSLDSNDQSMSERGVGIIGESTLDDDAELVEVYGQGCNYPTKMGVDGFQVDFDLLAYKGDEFRTFHIILQSEDRFDNIKAYNGFDMSFGATYGCDADEINELEDFLDAPDVFEEISRKLIRRGEKLCREWFDSNGFSIVREIVEASHHNAFLVEVENGYEYSCCNETHKFKTLDEVLEFVKPNADPNND